MDKDPLDELTAEELERLPPRAFELYKLRIEARAQGKWEQWRQQLATEHRRTDAYNSDFDAISTYAEKLYVTLLTSLLVMSGGGLTAIIAAAGGLGSDGISAPFDCTFRLLASAIILGFVGGALGRFGTDANLDALVLEGPNATKGKQQSKLRKRAKWLNRAAYATTLVGTACLIAALVIAMIAV